MQVHLFFSIYCKTNALTDFFMRTTYLSLVSLKKTLVLSSLTRYLPIQNLAI